MYQVTEKSDYVIYENNKFADKTVHNNHFCLICFFKIIHSAGLDSKSRVKGVRFPVTCLVS